MITADYYPNKSARKLIILFHQADYSRGEYNTIAPKLVEAGFACLAVDLRSGLSARNVPNETYTRAVSAGLGTKFSDARQDMKAAIAFAKANSEKQIVLWGSSYTASYVLMEGKDDPRVVKVLAFSPGEYFSNQNAVKSQINGYTKPIFVACTKSEGETVLSDVINMLPEPYAVKYLKAADHGSKALWSEKPGSDSLMMHILKFL
jgi:dienelactone hydrolase